MEWGNPKQMDEVTKEDFEWEYNSPNNLTHAVMGAAMDLMKLYGEALETFMLEKIGGYFYLLTKNPVVEDEIHYAVCFYADFFLYCSDGVRAQGYQNILKLALPSIEQTQDTNYQQTGAYFFGVQFHPFFFNFLTFLEPGLEVEQRTIPACFGKGS